MIMLCLKFIFPPIIIIVKDLCDPNPCANRGACTSNGVSFHCQCRPGLTGESCKGALYVQTGCRTVIVCKIIFSADQWLLTVVFVHQMAFPFITVVHWQSLENLVNAS